MSTSSDSSVDFFDYTMEFFMEEVIRLGRRGLGAVLGRGARDRYSPDQHQVTVKVAMAKALKYLSEEMSTMYRLPASIKSEEMSSRFVEAGLVNILFGCLPDPEEFEKSTSTEGLEELTWRYNGFKELIEFLSNAFERNELTSICGDPLLDGLLSIVDRVGTLGSQKGTLPVWRDELRRLAWETRGNTEMSTHKPPTVNLLKYLRWEVQGRKENFCSLEEPWKDVAQQDLSQLPPSESEGECANCSAIGADIPCTLCQPGRNDIQVDGTFYCSHSCREAHSGRHEVICRETRVLCRLAVLFEITFVQYLLSVYHGTTFGVSEEEGVLYTFRKNIQGHDLNVEFDATDVSPDLDLSLPKVRAALHGFRCCDIKEKARTLLDSFFSLASKIYLDKSDLCHWIQFLSFWPKNAHTPLEVESVEHFRFNMSALHTVALLTTPSGRQFVLDPTAAQYGWKEYLVSRATYDRYRIDFKYPPRDAATPDQSSTPSKVVAEDVLEIAQATFMQRGGLELIVHLPQAEFQEQCSKLEKALRSEMRKRDEARTSSQE